MSLQGRVSARGAASSGPGELSQFDGTAVVLRASGHSNMCVWWRSDVKTWRVCFVYNGTI